MCNYNTSTAWNQLNSTQLYLFWFSIGQMLWIVPGPWCFFGITSIKVPSKLRQYQKVTWKHCRLPIGQREALLPQPQWSEPKLSWLFQQSLSLSLFWNTIWLLWPHTKKWKQHSFDILQCSFVCRHWQQTILRGVQFAVENEVPETKPALSRAELRQWYVMKKCYYIQNMINSLAAPGLIFLICIFTRILGCNI